MHDKYVDIIKQQLEANNATNNFNEYVNYLKTKNTREQFTKLNLLTVQEIIVAVDKACAIKQTNKKTNTEKYESYINSLSLTENTISKRDLMNKIHAETYYHENEILLDDEVATNITRLIDQMTFDAEYKEFLSKNSDKIDHNSFSKDQFRKEIKQSDDYKTYGNSVFNNPTILFMLLMMHTDNIMAENKALESNNSSSYSSSNNTYDSFGGGFDGGSSSGGGFSGGW